MSLVDELVQVCRRVYENKFVSAYDGNVSARSPSNTFLITRSGVCKGEVTTDDI
jgi:L-fuculose-phosphate aldolase